MKSNMMGKDHQQQSMAWMKPILSTIGISSVSTESAHLLPPLLEALHNLHGDMFVKKDASGGPVEVGAAMAKLFQLIQNCNECGELSLSGMDLSLLTISSTAEDKVEDVLVIIVRELVKVALYYFSRHVYHYGEKGILSQLASLLTGKADSTEDAEIVSVSDAESSGSDDEGAGGDDETLELQFQMQQLKDQLEDAQRTVEFFKLHNKDLVERSEVTQQKLQHAEERNAKYERELENARYDNARLQEKVGDLEEDLASAMLVREDEKRLREKNELYQKKIQSMTEKANDSNDKAAADLLEQTMMLEKEKDKTASAKKTLAETESLVKILMHRISEADNTIRTNREEINNLKVNIVHEEQEKKKFRDELYEWEVRQEGINEATAVVQSLLEKRLDDEVVGLQQQHKIFLKRFQEKCIEALQACKAKLKEKNDKIEDLEKHLWHVKYEMTSEHR